MLLVHQRYFAKPGMADAVLQTRREADALLAVLGLPVGRTYVRVADAAGDDVPDVVWEASYEDLAERRRVEAILDASPEFTAVRRRQSSQLDRFDRAYFTLDRAGR